MHMAKSEIKTLVRPNTARNLARACLAVANHLNAHGTLVRLLWVFALLPGGVPGIIPYILCWIFIPSES